MPEEPDPLLQPERLGAWVMKEVTRVVFEEFRYDQMMYGDWLTNLQSITEPPPRSEAYRLQRYADAMNQAARNLLTRYLNDAAEFHDESNKLDNQSNVVEADEDMSWLLAYCRCRDSSGGKVMIEPVRGSLWRPQAIRCTACGSAFEEFRFSNHDGDDVD